LSKQWWTQEIADLRKEVGRAKRNRSKRPYALIEAKARKRLRRAIREAKKLHWNKFVSEATGQDVWTATRYTKSVTEASKGPLRDEQGTIATSLEENDSMIIQSAFPPAPIALPFHPGGAGSARTMVTKEMVEYLLGRCSNQSAPGEDRMGAEIIKTLLGRDADRVTHLVAECIRLGYHPISWKSARGIVIPTPGKPDYSRVRAYRVISLLDSLGKLVERTAAHLIANHLETNRLLHEGQYGSRVRRSTVDAAAVLMSRTQGAWKRKAVAGHCSWTSNPRLTTSVGVVFASE